MNVLNGGGVGSEAEGRVVPLLPSLSLSHLPATSDTRVSENRIQNSLLSACISDALQVHTQCLNRMRFG